MYQRHMAVAFCVICIFTVFIYIGAHYNASRIMRFETAVDEIQVSRGGGIVCHTRLAYSTRFGNFIFK